MRQKIKKFLCVALTLIMVFTVLPISAYAGVATSGSCGTNANWEYKKDNKLLFISGRGDSSSLVANYKSSSDTPWYDNIYIGKKISNIAEKLSINGVATVGTNSFSNMPAVTRADCSASIKNINANAFSSDKKLNTVTMPAVVIIRASAFENCSALRSVSMPAVQSIGANAFKNTGLTSVTLPESLKSIGANAFAGCPNLVVSCVKGSYADSYCRANNIRVSYTNALSISASLNESSRTIDVKLSLKGSKGFEGGNFEIRYNASVLAPVVKNELSASGITCFANYSTSGVVKLSAYSDSNVTSDNVNIATVSFKTKSQADSTNFTAAAANVTVSGKIISYDNQALNGFNLHKIKDIVVPSTCTAKGYTKHECLFCTKTYNDSETAMIDHKWQIVSETAAKCTQTGVRKEKCSSCGKTRDVTLNALGHSYNNTVVPATCKDRGYTLHTCTRCGYNYKDSYVNVDKTKHVMVVTEVVNPTCDKDGYRIEKCSVCNAADTEKRTVLPMTGHKYQETITPPTCTESGVKTEKCSVCGNVRTTAIDPTGHNYEDTTVEPKCTEDGYVLHKCSVCGDEYRDTIGATGHSYEDTTVEPKCTEDGYVIHKCSVCGDEYRDTIGAVGHAWDSGTVIRPATQTREGIVEYKCTRCGESRTERIAKLDPGSEPDNPDPTPDNPDPVPDNPTEKPEPADGVSNVNINYETKYIIIDAKSSTGIKYSAFNALFKTAPKYSKADDERVCTGDTVTAGNDAYTVIILGDVDFNGKVSTSDARLVLRMAARLETANEQQLLAGDLNENGKLSTGEARTLLRYAARLESSLR